MTQEYICQKRFGRKSWNRFIPALLMQDYNVYSLKCCIGYTIPKLNTIKFTLQFLYYVIDASAQMGRMLTLFGFALRFLSFGRIFLVVLKCFWRRYQSRSWISLVWMFWSYISIDTFSARLLCLVWWRLKGWFWWIGPLYHPVFTKGWLKYLLPLSLKGFVS